MTFLRPLYLLLLLVPFLFVKLKKTSQQKSIWEKIVDETLLPYVLIRGESKASKNLQRYKCLLWSLLVLGLAGPAWYKIPVPTRLEQPGTVIVMDLSTTMTGSLLLKAQQKIIDILDNLQGEQVGLVLYDKIGYTAGPLTFETNVIREMVPQLQQGILPVMGYSNPIAGFEQADRILKNAGLKDGRILFLTTGANIPDDFVSSVKKITSYKIGILGVGSQGSHPIPLESGGFLTDSHGKTIMVKLDTAQLKQLGPVIFVTPDARDVQNLIVGTMPDKTEGSDSTDQIEIWQDMGAYFVVLVLPFFAFLFRKKIFLLFILFSVSAEASLWLRPDQEAYLRQEQGVQFYRQSKYEKAADLFMTGFNPDDLYNLGNALAQQQKIQEAIDTYQQVLDEVPDHEDARFNKEYLEKELEKQQEPPLPPEEEKIEEQEPEEQPKQDPPPEEKQPEQQEENIQQEQSEQQEETQESPEDQKDESESSEEEQRPQEMNPPPEEEQQEQQEENIQQEQSEQQEETQESPEDQKDETKSSEEEKRPQEMNPPPQPEQQTDKEQAPKPEEKELNQQEQKKEENKKDAAQKEEASDKIEDETKKEPEKAPEQQQDHSDVPKDQEKPLDEIIQVDETGDEEGNLFSQKEQEILNQLPPPPETLLKYRLYQQYIHRARN